MTGVIGLAAGGRAMRGGNSVDKGRRIGVSLLFATVLVDKPQTHRSGAR
jgi:hypothetical protein